jgi:hypothetical protein
VLFGFLRVKPAVLKPLPAHTSEKGISALFVCGFAMVSAEIKLGHITLQVLFADVMECTDQAARQQAAA